MTGPGKSLAKLAPTHIVPLWVFHIPVPWFDAFITSAVRSLPSAVRFSRPDKYRRELPQEHRLETPA